MTTQNERTVSEFTRKAVVYATAPELNDEQALELLAMTADAGSRDEVLDNACGPGVVSCYLARRTHSVVDSRYALHHVSSPRLVLERWGASSVEAARERLVRLRGGVTFLSYPISIFVRGG